MNLSDIAIQLSDYKTKYDSLCLRMRNSKDLGQLNSLYQQAFELIDLNNDILIDYSHIINDQRSFDLIDSEVLNALYNENLFRIFKSEYDIFLFDFNAKNLTEDSILEFKRRIDYFLLFPKSGTNNFETTKQIEIIKSEV